MINIQDKEEISDQIIDIIGLSPYKVRNVYLYGSRVYGTADVSSDYDFTVIASSMMVNREFYEGLLRGQVNESK